MHIHTYIQRVYMYYSASFICTYVYALILLTLSFFLQVLRQKIFPKISSLNSSYCKKENYRQLSRLIDAFKGIINRSKLMKKRNTILG